MIEKLLRSCHDVDTIYTQIPSQKDNISIGRLEAFRSHFIFNRLRHENPTSLQKIQCLKGDCMEKNLGISPENQQMLQDNVNVVFHVNSSVKMKNQLSVAGQMNTVASRDLLELCLKMKYLSSLVYVSTAFVNSKDSHLVSKEEVKTYGYSINHNQFLYYMDHSDKQTIDGSLTRKLNIKPNAYIFSKYMTENVFKEYSQKLPIKIVRPSIVGASSQEPSPGFIDSYNATSEFFALTSLGKLPVMSRNGQLQVDIIPVDICVNVILAAGFLNSLDKELKVFNNTSGELNPVTFKQSLPFMDRFTENPSTLQTLPQPKFSFMSSRAGFLISFILTNLLPSVFKDIFAILLRQSGKSFELTSFSIFVMNFGIISKFISLNDLRFDNSNMVELVQFVVETGNEDEFDCDIRKINWNDYFKSYAFGILKHLFKDRLGNIFKSKL